MIKSSIHDLGACLIKMRIAKGYNHEEFGALLGVTAQQIQKYESDDYSGTSLRRIQEIVKLLNIETELCFKSKEIKEVVFLIPDEYDLEATRNILRERKMPLKMCIN